MQAQVSKFKILWMTFLATLLSVLVTFLATPILRILRNAIGSSYFWLSGLFIFGGLLTAHIYPLAFMIGASWILVGVYSEFEEKGLAGFWSAFSAVAIATGFSIGGAMLADKLSGAGFIAEMRLAIEGVLTQMQKGNAGSEGLTTLSGTKVDSSFILSQVPAVIFVLNIINLASALMADRKTAVLFGVRFERVVTHLRTLEFRLPDGFVWIAMLAFLGTFLKIKNPQVLIIASNVFTAMMGLYFFQGLAILECALISFKAGPFIRFLIYFIVVGQLFFVLSAAGFADYWIDFRKRLKTIRLKEKKSNNGEHI